MRGRQKPNLNEIQMMSDSRNSKDHVQNSHVNFYVNNVKIQTIGTKLMTALKGKIQANLLCLSGKFREHS